MIKKDLIYPKEYYLIKDACIAVRKKLGNGFLEKLYERALIIELLERGFQVESQKKFDVYYNKQLIGNYFADIVVDKKIIIEVKCVVEISNIHQAQILNYLKISNYKLGIIVNYPNNNIGVQVKRIPNFINKINVHSDIPVEELSKE